MRILLVGAGGVGAAFAAIAQRRDFFEKIVIADYDRGRADTAATDPRFEAAQVDASSAESVAALCREHAITHVMNAVDPRFVMPIFEGAAAAGADYLDMAMSLSQPHPYRAVLRVRGQARRRAVRAGRGVGVRGTAGPGRASASSRGCPTCSRGTPRTTCSPRSTSWASATGRT